MATPFYFAPRRFAAELKPRPNLLSRDFLTSMDMAEAWDDVRPEQVVLQQVDRGPSGTPGLWFTASTLGGRIPSAIGYHGERQHWLEFDEGVDGWIGFDEHEPPEPADLRRNTVIAGREVTLTSGVYLVPVARRPKGNSTELPRVVWMGRDGPSAILRGRYLDLFTRCGVFFDRSQAETVSIGEAVQLAADGLSVNYRINADVVNVLQLFDTENYAAVLDAMFDMDALKKNVNRAAETL